VNRCAHVILLLEGRYILQLRDDKPDIAARGLWGLFGGSLEYGEAPAQAVARELYEELMLRPPVIELFFTVTEFSEYVEDMVSYWFFQSDCTRVWDAHVLREGRDAKAFLFAELAVLQMTSLTRRVITMHHSAITDARLRM
jgi:8-oxo-dGTP pyrophosphatase MutT (NUDIX family)